MAEKQKTNVKRELKYVSNNFNSWNKEKQSEEVSNIIASVFINEITTENGVFFDISITTKDNKTHKSTLRQPMSEEDKQLNKKLHRMSPEQKKELLNKLE